MRHDVKILLCRAATIVFGIFMLSGCAGTDYDVTLGTLLEEMTDEFCVCEYPSVPYKAKMASSHDRKSTDPTQDSWYANDDGFGYERIEVIDGRREKVLFEENAPGAIMRIWITTRNPKSTLRFYFDGHAEPDWVMTSFDFTEFGLKCLEDTPLVCRHTSYEKGIKGGQTFFLPIPFAKGCKVTLEEPEGWSGVPRYYHIEYRKYPATTSVETFSVDVARKCAPQIRKAGKSMEEGIIPRGQTVSGGESLELPRGSRAVTYLEVTVDGPDSLQYGHVMRKLVLRGCFDGKETICVPLSDFSGAGMGAYPVDCRQLRADGMGRVECFYVMPYVKTASFCVENVSGVDCRIKLSVRTVAYEFTPNTLYFHASWKASEGLKVTNVQSECGSWNFATLTGRGIYAGDNLTLFNHSKAWYGEGDEKIYVDGEPFPSFFGTGTEDYYNSSWAPVVIFHTPAGGAPRADLASSRGYNTFLRTRLGDLIPFEKKFDFDLELISWIPGEVDYAATVYWYGDASASAKDTTDPLTHVYELPEAPPNPASFSVADCIEAEKLEPVSVSEGLHIDRQDMSGFPDGVWSGARQLVFYGGKTGDSARLRIESLEPGRYSVGIYATMAADYGVMAISLNGGKPYLLDCWFPSVVNTGSVVIGETDVVDFIDIDLSINGMNPKSKGNMMGIDCIVLNKIN